jgi:glycosyltransferase involved in cell wall biosynthesis
MHLRLMLYGSLREQSGGFLYDRMLVKALTNLGHSISVQGLPWRGYGRSLWDNFDRRWGAASPNRADIILQDELIHPSVFLQNARLRERSGRPIVAIVHHLRSEETHPAWLRPVYRGIERRYLQSVDGFIFNSRATRASVEALVGTETRGVVAYPGVDHLRANRISSAGRAPAGRLQVLFVGNLTPRKRLPDLLQALAALPPRTWQLTIVGRSPRRDRGYGAGLRHLAARSSGGRVRFAGRLGPGGLGRALARADVLAIPSDHEGFGLAYLEAMLLGVVPIASRHGGAGELILDGYNGFLVPARRPDLLADRLRELTADRNLLHRMSRAARKTAHSWPSWASAGRKVHDFLLALEPSVRDSPPAAPGGRRSIRGGMR